MTASSRIFLLGSTGSIGCNTIEVVEHLRRAGIGEFPIVALGIGSNIEALAAQEMRTGASFVSIASVERSEQYEGDAAVYAGPGGAAEMIRSHARAGDIVVAAVVGSAGIDAVMAGIERGCRVALANKETLVAAGSLVMPAAQAAGVDILPVDSEHSAIFQCLHGGPSRAVERIVLTASGGPFRGRSRKDIASATVDEALAHPTWSMGRKITIDSATLANKALEIIEAHWLFGLPAERIDAVTHPQSIIHGFVEFMDGSVLAQAGPPDMRTPIQLALTWPDRVSAAGRTLCWDELRSLDFAPIDHETFPMIQLAWDAIRAGGTAGTVLNAANEAAVESFLDGRIRFGDIFTLVTGACEAVRPSRIGTMEDVWAADRAARSWVTSHQTSVMVQE
ncbi:MAG: 1-deoxy-D-xylulose-5-phosphate reductoisomerase [Phycisphaerales bacterium]|nr:1-deoxy-D-xylulose-5-phosphate reductoisomerase [Phycisphaerales bacterium]